jgi:cell division septation protein DedD
LGYYVGKHVSPSENNQSSIIPKEKSLALNNQEPEHQEEAAPGSTHEQDIRSHAATPTIHEKMDTTKTNQSAEAKQNQPLHEIQKPHPPLTKTTKITYTVQAGAFKSSQEAGILKDKLVKKGYTAYIIQSESKKHENLYKVMIGKFPTRKQAEVLSLKIKKSEGLQTFVTFGTKEDILR